MIDKIAHIPCALIKKSMPKSEFSHIGKNAIKRNTIICFNHLKNEFQSSNPLD